MAEFKENPVKEVLFQGEKVENWKGFHKIKVEIVEYNEWKKFASEWIKLTISKFRNIDWELCLDKTQNIHIWKNAFKDMIVKMNK